MKSPFKFLDAFTRKDKKHFFGRDEEIERLYQMVFETPLVLIYGLSGTGKTSLVQCGLAGKFEGPDWFPFFIRRNDNINNSLNAAIDKYIRTDKDKKNFSLSKKISFINASYFRPVYLIFDQFEELFILGKEEEQTTFINSIKELLDAKISCRVIFIIREEYYGQLYNFEKTIPYIFNHRLRVEPMDRETVKRVLGESFGRFNISLESPEESRKEEIIDNISAQSSGIQLPYLQVYLDGLYKEDYLRTYGKNGHVEQYPNLEFPPLTFTKKEIKKFGTIENALEDFIDKQKEEIYQSLKKEKQKINKTTIPRILDALVTIEGTKLPVFCKKDVDQKIIPITGRFINRLPKNLSPKTLNRCIEKLENSRIIRFIDEKTFELAHDSIAAIIDQKRTEEDRRLNQIAGTLESAYREYNKHKVYLTRKQIDQYKKPVLLLKKQNRIDKEIFNFFEKSEESILQEEKKQKEADEQKIRNEQKIISEKGKRRTATVFAFIAFCLATLAGLQFFEANKLTEKAIKADFRSEVEAAYKFKAHLDYPTARNNITKAISLGTDAVEPFFFSRKRFLKLDQFEPSIKELKNFRVSWDSTNNYLNLADTCKLKYEKSNSNLSDIILLDILENYLNAFRFDNEQSICNRINETVVLIQEKISKWQQIQQSFEKSDYAKDKSKTPKEMVEKLNQYKSLIKHYKVDAIPIECKKQGNS